MSKTETIEVLTVQKRLVLLWVPVVLLVLLGMILFTLLGRFEDDVEKVWGWFVPQVLPALTLILAAWRAHERRGPAERVRVSRLLGTVVMLGSIVYFLVLLLTLGFGVLPRTDPMSVYGRSGVWLGVAQGLLTTFLGYVHVGQKDEEAAPRRAAAGGTG